jgi:hypothetical protein
LSTVGDDLHPGAHSDYLFYKNNRLQVGEAYWHITSPGVLNALRTHGVATFQTVFSDIDDDVGARTELKIERIEVALVGAKAKNPIDRSVEVWVTHSGRATNRRHVDNTVVALDAPSLSEAMQATLTGIGANVLQSSHTDPRLSRLQYSHALAPYGCQGVRISLTLSHPLRGQSLSQRVSQACS